jgi:hypothetical protein
MQEILSALRDTPIPTILVVSGVLFLLLSVADQFAGKISINPARQRLAVVIGSVLIILGISLYILPSATTPQIGSGPEENSNSTRPATTNHETRPDEMQTGPSPRKPGYGTLEGRVTNEDGEAIFTIIYLYQGGERIGPGSSKKKMGGFFQFSKLKSGMYEIQVERTWDSSNYRPQRIKNVKINPGVLTNLDITLSEGDDLQQIDNPVVKEQAIEGEINP